MVINKISLVKLTILKINRLIIYKMSRLKNKSIQLSPEEIFLRQQARERAFLEEQEKHHKDADKIIEIIREEEKENVRQEVLNEKRDVILQIHKNT